MARYPDTEVILDADVFDFLGKYATDNGLSLADVFAEGLKRYVVELKDNALWTELHWSPSAPKFRPDSTPGLILHLLTDGERRAASDIAEALDTGVGSIRSALSRLVKAGLVKSEKFDHLRMHRGLPLKLWERA